MWNGRLGTDGRTREYVYGTDTEAYTAHEAFFLETVIPWAESRFPISRDRAERAIFGVSNGAAFSTSASRQHPSLFGAVIAFSHAFDGLGWTAGEDLSGVRFYLKYGDQEAYVDETTESVGRIARLRGGDVFIGTWTGGHDPASWGAEFPAAVAWFTKDGF